MARPVDIAQHNWLTAQPVSDPHYRKYMIQTHYPEMAKWIGEMLQEFPGARVVEYQTEKLEWTADGIIQGKGVMPSLSHLKRKKK